MAIRAGKLFPFVCQPTQSTTYFDFWHLQFEENGFAVIDGFLTADEIAEVYAAGRSLYKNAPAKDRKLFMTSRSGEHSAIYRDNYFIESSNKIHYFFENDALGEDGELIVDPAIALNKVSC